MLSSLLGQGFYNGIATYCERLRPSAQTFQIQSFGITHTNGRSCVGASQDWRFYWFYL